jgi:riboflavin synthase
MSYRAKIRKLPRSAVHFANNFTPTIEKHDILRKFVTAHVRFYTMLSFSIIFSRRNKMFTGLIEETGTILSTQRRGTSKRLVIAANLVMDDLNIDDSIAINGACQTVIARSDTSFSVDSIDETLRKTTLGNLSRNSRVNLERAVRADSRLGGHIVQGHVDCTGKIREIHDIQGSRQVWVEFPPEFGKYVVPVGSVCLDGVSLTVARVERNAVMVALIPHTLAVTTLGEWKTGDPLNIEFDIIGKYVEKMTAGYGKIPSVFDTFSTHPE